MESAKWKEGKSAELSLELPEPHLDVIWLKNGTQISVSNKHLQFLFCLFMLFCELFMLFDLIFYVSSSSHTPMFSFIDYYNFCLEILLKLTE